MMMIFSAAILAVISGSALANSLDEGWRACQEMREAKMVHGRVTAGDYKPEVHDACNKIAAELHARAQPKPPTEQEMENAAKAAISAAGQK